MVETFLFIPLPLVDLLLQPDNKPIILFIYCYKGLFSTAHMTLFEDPVKIINFMDSRFCQW